MPESQATAPTVPVPVEIHPAPGTPSWWAAWAGKTPLDRLLILGLVTLVGFFVYDQSAQKRNEREDRNRSMETELRVRQEEQERNRQSAAERDKTQREWSQFENDRTRRSIDENTKAVLTFNGNAVRLEAAVNALVRRLGPVGEPAPDDPCELRPWWHRLRDVTIAEHDLPIHRRRAPDAVRDDFANCPRDNHGARVVDRRVGAFEYKCRRRCGVWVVEGNPTLRHGVGPGRQRDADAMPHPLVVNAVDAR